MSKVKVFKYKGEPDYVIQKERGTHFTEVTLTASELRELRDKLNELEL